MGIVNGFSLVYLKDTITWTCVRAISSKTTAVASSTKRKQEEKTEEPSSPLTYWFWALTLVQFHTNFYASRTLPNFFATPLTNIAIAYVLEASYTPALAILAFAAVVFRAELALLLASLALSLLLFRRISIFSAVKTVVISGLSAAALSAAVDSYFWQRPVIPELQGFLFNVVEGRSQEWGTEPYSAYFVHHLPKLLGAVEYPGYLVLLLAPFGLLRDPTARFNHVRVLAAASTIYVALYSLQPHKEWRFIVYVAPVYTLLFASGVVQVSHALQTRVGEVMRVGFQLLVATLIAGIAAGTGIKTLASVYNYPGGDALSRFHSHVPYVLDAPEPLVVHMDVATCMSGASLFGQQYAPALSTLGRDSSKVPWVVYDKTEDEEALEEIADSFDFVISATSPDEIAEEYPLPDPRELKWKVVETAKGFNGIDVFAVKQKIKEFDWKTIVAAETWNKALEIEWGEVGEIVEGFLKLKDSIWVYKKVKNDQPYPWEEVNLDD